jgi:hypothetical protein
MSEQPDGFTRLTYWIPAILVAMMISAFSTHYFTDERTSRIIVPVRHWLFRRRHPGCSTSCTWPSVVFHGVRGAQWLATQIGGG